MTKENKDYIECSNCVNRGNLYPYCEKTMLLIDQINWAYPNCPYFENNYFKGKKLDEKQ